MLGCERGPIAPLTPGRVIRLVAELSGSVERVVTAFTQLNDPRSRRTSDNACVRCC